MQLKESFSRRIATKRAARLEAMRRNTLITFIVKRIAVGLLLMLGITFISFSVTQLVPGDPAALNLGQSAMSDPTIVAAWRAKYGLDKPVPEQYIIYLNHLLHGDLGISQQSQRPVSTDLKEYFPATLELATVAIFFSLIFGLIFGIIAAISRDKWPDQVIRFFTLTGVSVPTFWLALVFFYIFYFKLSWFPSNGRLDPGVDAPSTITGMYTVDALLHGQFALAWQALRHIMLPAIVLAIYTIAVLTRFTRASILEILHNDYVRAARAKGLPESLIIRRHVMRPALLSIVTVAGVAFGNLLAGSVLVENIFSWPGIGQYAYRSSIGLDLPGIMGVSIVVAGVFITMNLLVDIAYRFIDPSLRHG